MTSWLDTLARRVARRQALDAPTPRRGMSRRDFLRRSGVVGAAVWSVPALQSATAPAAAASGPCSQGTLLARAAGCPLCGVGAAPVWSMPSVVTSRCSGGTCQPGQLGDTCLATSDCAQGICSGGVCVQGVTGDPCDAPVDCITGICTGGTCRAGGISTAVCDHRRLHRRPVLGADRRAQDLRRPRVDLLRQRRLHPRQLRSWRDLRRRFRGLHDDGGVLADASLHRLGLPGGLVAASHAIACRVRTRRAPRGPAAEGRPPGPLRTAR